MKSLMQKFEKTMASAAFAEEGEIEASRTIMNEDCMMSAADTAKRNVPRPAVVKELCAE